MWLRWTDREHAGRKLQYVTVRVLDNGLGLSPEALRAIFLARIMNAGGTGLGTAIVDSEVRRHEGFIEVVSEPGLGTAISVHLSAMRKTVHAGHPDLEPYRRYADTRWGQGRWSGFEAAARDEPAYREVRVWMRESYPDMEKRPSL